MTQALGHMMKGVFSRLPACALSIGALCFSNFAFAQTTDNASTKNGLTGFKTKAVTGLSTNLNSGSGSLIGLSPTLRGALIDMPDDETSLFNLDFSESGCFSDNRSCLSSEKDFPEIGYSAPSYLKLNSKGLDLELTPSAAMRFNDDSSSAVVGALLRIGDDLRKDSDFDNNTWYFFAGADAEALTYRPNGASDLTRGNFNLQDRVIVGDAQAGVGYRIGDADLSLSYMRREVSGLGAKSTTDDSSYKEDAATLSFTWRR